MRSFAIFLGLFLVGFAVMALFAWPLYDALTPSWDVKFHRVANRLGMVALLVGFVLVARRLRVADRASLGFGLQRSDFLREALLGLALGVATMLPIALLMFATGLRTLKPEFALDASLLVQLALGGLATGVTVALIEETFMRGAMHSAIERESGTTLAILLTALLYSAVHFVGRYRIPVEELGWDSGLRHVLGTLADFATPLDIIDAFLALAAVGILLGMVRALTGNIAACIGLHAGWVWVIAFLRASSQPNEAHAARMLLSEFDGVVGWLVLAATGLIGLVLIPFYAKRSRNWARVRN
jgi:membrane protease YdiL (CAAX protease family)